MYHRILYFFTVSALLLSIVACTGDGQKKITREEINEMEKEIIRLHDEVMPRMSDIARLSSVLEQEANNSNLDSTTLHEISMAVLKLHAGDSLMWEWMHNYEVPENVSMDSMYIYLKLEKQRMEHVRDVMQDGIEHAEGLAQKLGYGQPN